MTKLKACPFCGEDDQERLTLFDTLGYIECGKCDATGPTPAYGYDWNSRATPKPEPKRSPGFSMGAAYDRPKPEPSSELVERVAIAIHNAMYEEDIAEIGTIERELFKQAARAAIASTGSGMQAQECQICAYSGCAEPAFEDAVCRAHFDEINGQFGVGA